LPWLAGAQFPEDDPLVRGGFLGLSLDTRREHLVRAVIEGVSLNLTAAIGPVEGFAEQAFSDLALSGGGALSSGWAQILADASGRAVRQLRSPRYVNTLAAALLVFDDLGVTSLDRVDAFVPTERTFEPRQALTSLYAALATQQRAALTFAQSFARP
jgi:xylulokinase